MSLLNVATASAERRFPKDASIQLVDPTTRYHVVARCLQSTYRSRLAPAPLVTKVRIAGVIVGYLLHWNDSAEFTFTLDPANKDGQRLLVQNHQCW